MEKCPENQEKIKKHPETMSDINRTIRKNMFYVVCAVIISTVFFSVALHPATQVWWKPLWGAFSGVAAFYAITLFYEAMTYIWKRFKK